MRRPHKVNPADYDLAIKLDKIYEKRAAAFQRARSELENTF